MSQGEKWKEGRGGGGRGGCYKLAQTGHQRAQKGDGGGNWLAKVRGLEGWLRGLQGAGSR